MAENKSRPEVHGCIVCGRLFNIVAVYSSSGSLVDFMLMSPGGHRVENDQYPLVACNTHSETEINTAVEKWQAQKVTSNGQDDD